MKIGYFVLLLVISSIAIPSYARDWSSYSSENFTIYSDVRPGKAIQLLKEFEIFRQLAFFSLGIPPKPSNNKMKILMYAKSGEYRKVGPKNTIGFFINTTAGPRMVIGSSRGTISRQEILYHEYIHYLMREHSTLTYPRWYDEGLAEVLGATTIKGSKATIGAIPEGRSLSIRSERPFKIDELLAPDQEDDSLFYQSRFYAYAWLFTHYLQISALRENPELEGQTTDYIQRFNRGEDSQEAFFASFGKTPEEMDTELRKYRNQRRFTVLTVDLEEFQGEIERAELGPGEQVYLLADIAWRVGKEDVALEYLEDIDQNDATFAQALSLAAVLENHKDEEDKIRLAKSYAEKSIALAPNDSQVLTNYAHWLVDNRSRLEEQEEVHTTDVVTLIQEQINFSQNATSIDPTNVEALRFLWQGQLENGDGIEALKTMMLAYQEEPFSVGINYTIGRHLIGLRRSDLALPFIERVRNWSHSIEQRKEMNELVDKIRKENASKESE